MKALASALAVVLATFVWGGNEEGAGACLAVERDVERDTTLPRPVGRTEAAILRAAYACDYDGLVRLAGFDFAAPDLASLIALFEGPVVLDGVTYIWPGTEAGGPRTAISDDGTWQSFETGETNVLAATDDGRIVLLDADGAETDELGTVNPDDASNGFAVSPDGRFAYFDRGGLPSCEAEVVRLNLETGRERTVATGSQPAISPNGRRLAYLACKEGSEFPDRLVVRRLASGKEEVAESDGPVMATPSWAPDSRHVAIELLDPPEIRVLDLGDGDPFAESDIVELESVDNTFWAGYRGATGEFYALTAPGGEAGAGSPLQVIAIDAETGQTLGTLFELDAQCCLIALAADAAGTGVLAAGTNAGLVVWRDGDATTQPLAPGIRTAAWLST